MTLVLQRTAGPAGLSVTFDGGGSAISAGTKIRWPAPFAATITGWEMLADVSGSAVVDVWKDTYANYPPTVADSITAADKPTLSGAIKAQGTALTGWDTSLEAGDVLIFNVDSASTVTQLTVALTLTRFGG